ncbi:hypothetical protein [Salinispora arenicola]|uniref:hypothetical protein n=1 Tax=Salinispora arenicola TaxID=168697 RepID=UPI0016961835|nr:hypothetical protein [Salinispora arenicola]NIL56236.1 hypothetical protein [Salinispora arenicola]NIL62133.1 hypothetical protein [Salinispora arenicola]
MPEIRTVHTARTAHDCQALYCATTIRPGARYLAVTPPAARDLIAAVVESITGQQIDLPARETA